MIRNHSGALGTFRDHLYFYTDCGYESYLLKQNPILLIALFKPRPLSALCVYNATSIAVVELPKISASAARLEVIDSWPYYGPQCQGRLHKGIKIGVTLKGIPPWIRDFVMVQSVTAKSKRMTKRRKAGGGYTP